MAESTLTVVVPAYNEDEVIEECLERLLAEGSEIDEIIVVDNNSTDRTVALVEAAAAANPVVKLIRETRQGLVWARNAGLDVATSSVIARIARAVAAARALGRPFVLTARAENFLHGRPDLAVRPGGVHAGQLPGRGFHQLPGVLEFALGVIAMAKPDSGILRLTAQHGAGVRTMGRNF